MNISIFDILGPIMIGPSSSHTAGAAKLARVARDIVKKPFSKVRFGLCGSFAKTGLGHGTHQALLAGALGLREDDERIKTVETLARQAGIGYEFYETELDDAHDNTVILTFFCTDDTTVQIIGCSVGGGRICITDIDGMAAEIMAETTTLVIEQLDKPGVVNDVSRLLAENGINIGVMRVSRVAKGELASCVIETDSAVSEAMESQLTALKNVRKVRIINV
ncbi:MAG: L-serine ammonia-lyase, iron-sulfur-dependent subunit beta [Pygmaiobacter sp.]